MQNKKHWWLYVLKLEQGKYCVGITSKGVEARFAQHKSGFAGAAWTKKYTPLGVFDTEDLGMTTKDHAELFEARVTRKYIEKYGLNNVRGGDLTETKDKVKRFGRFFDKEMWLGLTAIVFLLAILAAVLFIK